MSLGLFTRYGLSRVVAGGGGGPDATEYYVPITIQSSQVASTLTSFPVYVDLSDLPAAFWTNVQSDGGDIRVTENDGTTRAPVELVAINTGASTGELHFLASSLSSSTNTVYRLYYGKTGGGLTQPAVGATYGRNAVWADYELVWHLSEDPSGTAPQTVDSSGNGHLGSSSGTMTSGDLVTGKVGEAVQFDGSDDRITSAVSTVTLDDFTITLWHKIDSLSGVDFIASADDGSDAWYFVTSATTGNWGFSVRDFPTTEGIATSGGFTANDSAWHYAAARRNGTELWINQDASGSPATTTVTTAALSTPRPRVSGRDSDGSVIAATVDEFRMRKSVLSADWMASEYTNQNTPTTFYAVGSETAA